MDEPLAGRKYGWGKSRKHYLSEQNISVPGQKTEENTCYNSSEAKKDKRVLPWSS